MGIQIQKSDLSGVLIITPPTIHKDPRGMNIETYNFQSYKEAGIEPDFIHDAISVSKKGVLRGFHGDNKTWKLISCLFGQVFFAVVNWDANSDEYKKTTHLLLSSDNNLQVLIPPHFGNAHLVLSEYCVFSYKQSEYYDREGQFTVPWDHPELNVPWPHKKPILSARDSSEGREI